MVVDDEKWTLMGICRTFRWAAYGFGLVFSSTNPQEALEHLLTDPPDAAFLDIRMPGLTGLDMIQRAREAGVTTEFVIVSGIQDFQYAVTCIRNAAFDYCLKPLTQQQADETLENLKAHLDAHGVRRVHAGGQATRQVHSGHVLAGGEEAAPDNFANLLAYVDGHFAEPMQVKDISAMFFLSPNYVSSLFRSRLNTTFSTYVNDLRINKAAHLLINTRKSVAEIAELCGYSEPQYFIRIFRTRMRVTPLKYRNENAGGEGNPCTQSQDG